jgi:hypothetical protein
MSFPVSLPVNPAVSKYVMANTNGVIRVDSFLETCDRRRTRAARVVRTVFGCDIDPVVVVCARIALSSECEPDDRVRVGDVLLHRLLVIDATQNSNIFREQNCALVLCNPPWRRPCTYTQYDSCVHDHKCPSDHGMGIKTSIQPSSKLLSCAIITEASHSVTA